MRDANENILKMIVNNVHESVEFLEKFISTCTVEHIYKPTSTCFRSAPQEAENASLFEFDWEKSEIVALEDIKNMVRG